MQAATPPCVAPSATWALSLRWAGAFSLLLCFLPAGAQTGAPGMDTSSRELQRLQGDERHRREAHERRPNVRFPAPAAEVFSDGLAEGAAPRLPSDESPCIQIDRLAIEGDAAAQFPWLLASADRSVDGGWDPAIPRCLGARGIAAVLSRLQRALVTKGYVTSRVLVGPQNLRTGTLTLTLVPGRMRAIRLAPGSNPRAGLASAFPLQPGDLLNLPAVEQGLENLRRLPTASAEIDIAPALAAPDQPGTPGSPGHTGKTGISGNTGNTGNTVFGPGDSDLVVDFQQVRLFRGSLTVDDSGIRSLGRLQGTLDLALDNPLRQNDIFQLSLQHGLDPQTDRHGLRGQSLQYSLPWGRALVSLSANRQRFYQQVVGSSQTYVYSGESESAELSLRHLLRRDGASKTFASLALWRRASRQFIEDTEIEVQRRRTAGWTLGADHRQFIGPATLDLALSHRRGTGAAYALPAPEQAFGEGVSRPHITSAGAQLDWPLQVSGPSLRYSGSWRAQWSHDPLVPLDRFTIGGRYTVRGFDGESVLSAQQGWWLRNELAWEVGASGHEVFLGLDHGQVSGWGAAPSPSNWLTGAVLGWRGVWPHLRVELFAGGPVRQPRGFPAPEAVVGFSLSSEF